MVRKAFEIMVIILSGSEANLVHASLSGVADVTQERVSPCEASTMVHESAIFDSISSGTFLTDGRSE